MKKKWIYYGIFFTENQQKALLKRANTILKELNKGDIPLSWQTYCEHMTIIYNNKSVEREEIAEGMELMLGNIYSLHINSIGISDKAIAFGVDNFETQNKTSHITIAVAPGEKPVESNNISNWIKLEKGFTIKGRLNVQRPT